MEVTETNTLADKSVYANTCIFIKQIEAINLAQVYRAMTTYLSFLILPEAEHYLSIFGQHLSDPFSWLNKAQLLSQAEAQRESAKAHAAAATSAMDQLLWEDSAKKLNYLIESWDSDTYTACQQIIQGIAMLINEHIPLSDVQSEIIDFAAGRNVHPPVLKPEESVTQKLERLLCDAYANSSNVFTKLARTISVQAELFLNRLVQSEVSFDRLDIRQSFLFEANYKLCEFIETQSQRLKSALTSFSEKFAERIAMRLNRIAIDGVFKRYSESVHALPTTVNDTLVHHEKDDDEEDEWNFDPPVSASPESVVQPMAQEIPATTSSLPTAAHAKLENLLSASEELLETVIKKVSLHRLQLSCSSRLKACYGKFSLFPLFRHIATKLTHYHQSLSDSLSELSSMMNLTGMTEALRQRLNTVIKALQDNLERVKTYLATLNVHHKDYSVTEEIPSWQSRLHDLILGSSEEELVMVESRLQRIEAMDSPYLRATLIMKLDSAKLKLNDMIIANMQSWSSRFVDRETVENTLRYLGIRIHPSHLNKIAPNIRIPKKRVATKKDFYSAAADYGMAAWKSVRAWLDKQVING